MTAIVIEALTLHGIGSYIDGARLEIKPLTILCGTNGSGKSTWLRVLNLLQESLKANRLPFGFSVSDWDPNNIQLTNALYHQAPISSFEDLDSSDDNDQFGPPGTIGIELRTSTSFQLRDCHSIRDDRWGEAWNFLFGGHCAQGSHFRLRFAHPTYWDDSQTTPHLRHHFKGAGRVRTAEARSCADRSNEWMRFLRSSRYSAVTGQFDSRFRCRD